MKRFLVIGVLLALYASPWATAARGQAPAKAPGDLPEWHGIANWGWQHHFMDLALALLDKDGELSESGKALRAELRLTDEDQAKLLKRLEQWLLDSFVKDGKDADISRQQMFEIQEMLLKQLAAVLDGNKLARFEELGCQYEGPMALRFDRFARRVGLSAVQQQGVVTLVDEYFEKSAPFHRAEFHARSGKVEKKLLALAKELDARILATLTEAQRQRWQACLGKRFDWSKVATGPGDDD